MKSGLLTTQLFTDLTDVEMESLSAVMSERRFENGATVFVENMPGEALYLIESGRVRLSKMITEGDERTLGTLGPQDYFGELALVATSPRAVTARVVGDAILWSMKKSDFDRLCHKHPALAVKLLRNLLAVFAHRMQSHQPGFVDLIVSSARPA